MSPLSQWVKDLEAHFESVKSTAEAFLETHVPGLAELAAKVEASPLLAAAERIAGTVDPAAEAVLAEALAKLASLAPAAPAPLPPAEPAPAAPADEQNLHAG